MESYGEVNKERGGSVMCVCVQPSQVQRVRCRIVCLVDCFNAKPRACTHSRTFPLWTYMDINVHTKAWKDAQQNKPLGSPACHICIVCIGNVLTQYVCN